MAKVKIVENHIDEVLEELEKKKHKILETIGSKAEGYVQGLTPVDTDNLRSSITHIVRLDDSEVDIGTNVEYAPYVEFNDNAKHTTGKAHYLRDGIQNNMEEFKKIIEEEMKK